MKLHNLQRKNPNYKRLQVGRGGKRGKTSGRGTKGQDARSGRKKRPELRDFIKRMPKLRGYAFKSFAPRAVPVALSSIEKNFKAGERVEPATLIARGVVERTEGNFPRIKILSGGEITIKVTVSGVEISKGAKAAIEKAGGKVHA
jgi:large subunit ribosomal protein L15